MHDTVQHLCIKTYGNQTWRSGNHKTCACTNACRRISAYPICPGLGALTSVSTVLQGSNIYSVLLDFTERTNIDVLILGMPDGACLLPDSTNYACTPHCMHQLSSAHALGPINHVWIELHRNNPASTYYTMCTTVML